MIDEPLRHGYTMADLHRIAKHAAHSAYGWMSSDYLDVLETAWFGAVEHLYTAEDPPRRTDLIAASRRAVNRLSHDQLHHAGHYKRRPDAGPGSMPAFVTYWWHQTAPTPSPENSIVERHSLAQIVPLLTDAQRDALVSLAVHDNHLAAADALDLNYRAFRTRIFKARRRFLALWHEGEQPSKPWSNDRRVYRYEDPP